MRRVERYRWVGGIWLGLFAFVGLYAQTGSDTPRLYWTGTFGGQSSEARGVSGDGSIVAGWTFTASGQRRAFRWTRENGIEDLGTLGGNTSEAYAISLNGRVIVGISTTAQAGFSRPFRWQSETGMQPLGDIPGVSYDVSGDGSVIVASLNINQRLVAYRWTALRGYEPLTGFPETVLNSNARGITPDGTVIVGFYRNADSPSFLPFRWRDGVVETLPVPRGGAAFGVSADGMVVVGRIETDTVLNIPARWRNGVLEVLSATARGSALSANRDGTKIVGSITTPQGERAFLWTEQEGLVDLNQKYASLLAGGAVLYRATAITPDGRYIVGYGLNPDTRIQEGFLLDTIPEPSSLLALGAGVGLLVYRRTRRQ